MSSTSTPTEHTPTEHTPTEHTPTEHSYSADPSGYVTSRPRRNPPLTEERDPYDNGEEVTSQTPTRLPQPATRGPRVRVTARKSIPLPRRVTLTVPSTNGGETSRQREQGGTSQIVTGYPMRHTQGMTPGEGRWVQCMESELHTHRYRLDHQHHVLGNLTEMLDSHDRQLARAMEAAVTARRVARILYLCLLMMALMMTLLGLLFWRMMH